MIGLSRSGAIHARGRKVEAKSSAIRLVRQLLLIGDMRLPILFLGLSLVTVSACGSGTQVCPPGPCLPTALGVVGNTSPTMGLSGVQATLTGPANETLSCQSTGTGAECSPNLVGLTSGTYSVKVSAPGYQTLNSQVAITAHPGGMCECGWATFQPSTVSLSSADAGTD